jgi:hypothetical protein
MKQFVLPVLILAAALFAPAASAETSDESACMSDAFRVCWRQIPDRHEVFLCLLANRNRISEACRVKVVRARAAHRIRRGGYDAREDAPHYHYEQD